MKRILLTAATAAALTLGVAHAAEVGTFGRVDHVFLIIMENQTASEILGSPNAPFINAYAKVANHATNYYAVGHPSAPNYLEIVGGSNFGLKNDFWPAWVRTGCVDNAPGSTGCDNALPPIAGPGTDNAVVATATKATQCNGQIDITGNPVKHNCALRNYPAMTYTPKSIADQLVEKNMTWKTYQESLPILQDSSFGINYADGTFSNLSPAPVFDPGPIQKLYAVKHNPFAYFRNIQLGKTEALSLSRVVDFDGPNGLWADLRSPATFPNFAVIVPNQCHDMHGFISGGTPICSTATAAEGGLLMQEGDAEVGKIVNGIKASPAWQRGRNAIVLVWDENDFSNAANNVIMLVETNYAQNGRVSRTPVDHYSLLRTMQAGFRLRCLNHSCDTTSVIMNDMFGG